MAEQVTFDAAAVQQDYQKLLAFLGQTPKFQERREAVRSRMGPTPRHEIFREHSVTLYRYDRSEPATVATPMLVVPSLVNMPCIMDLIRGESFIEAMLERGFDVFMLEWGHPTPGQKHYDLEHYLRTYLGRAVRRTMRVAGADGVSLAGYCLGGTMALLYSALDGRGARQVKNLVTMVGPVNFDDRGMLSWWSREEHFDVDKVVDAYGNMPADFFSRSFPWLLPTANLTKARMLYDRHEDEEFMESFLALDIWGTENTPFPGDVYREFIKKGYQQNVLVKTGEWPMKGGAARLADVACPVLNLAGQYDHICPFESCMKLDELIPEHPDVTSKHYPAGHLGIALGKDALGNRTTAYWDEVADWLKERS